MCPKGVQSKNFNLEFRIEGLTILKDPRIITLSKSE